MLEGGEVFYGLDVTANLVHRQMMQTKQFNLRTNNSIQSVLIQEPNDVECVGRTKPFEVLERENNQRSSELTSQKTLFRT